MATKTHFIGLRVTEEQYDKLTTLAAELGVTGSALVREVLFGELKDVDTILSEQGKTITEMSVKLDLLLTRLGEGNNDQD